MKRHPAKRQVGFTLVELLISFALLSILSTFAMLLAGQFALITQRIHQKNSMISSAQAQVEDLRSTLNIPSYAQETGDPNYTMTVSSDFITKSASDPQIIKYLRKVTIDVSGGNEDANLITYIQTYRPQVGFLLPTGSSAFISGSGKTTDLLGSIFTETSTLAKDQIQIRTSDNGGLTWTSSWISLTQAGGDVYLDPEGEQAAPAILQPNVQYYFRFSVQGGTVDGLTLDVQVQATDSKGLYNFQPTEPQAGSSYIRLLTDDTKPQFSAVSFASAHSFSTDPPSFAPDFQCSVQASDSGSGVLQVFWILQKTEPGAVSLYWDEGAATPSWSSTAPAYNLAEAETNDFWQYPPIATPSLATAFQQSLQTSPSGTIFHVQAIALDKVIGEGYHYRDLIPPQTYTVLPWANVNANEETVSATVIKVATPSNTTLPPQSISPSTAVLNSWVNSNGSATLAWYEITASPSITTPQMIVSHSLSFDAVAYPYTMTNLLPGTTYSYRIWALNNVGFSNPGEWVTFQTPGS